MKIYGTNATRQNLPYTAIPELEVELSWYAITELGLRRETNEDSFVISPPLFAVADGMGGHAAGDIASAQVVKRLAEAAASDAPNRENIFEALKNAVQDINEIVGVSELGAGTTVTGVTFSSESSAPTWDIFNIGDSRVYQSFRGALTQVTSDHSVVQHLIDTGAITDEEAETHPHANVITRAVGFNEDPLPDYVQLAIIPGQRLLICSDGLTKELTHIGIQHFLTAGRNAKEAATELVEQALNNSGRDNITVIVIDVHAVGDDADTTELFFDEVLTEELKISDSDLSDGTATTENA